MRITTQRRQGNQRAPSPRGNAEVHDGTGNYRAGARADRTGNGIWEQGTLVQMSERYDNVESLLGLLRSDWAQFRLHTKLLDIEPGFD